MAEKYRVRIVSPTLKATIPQQGPVGPAGPGASRTGGALITPTVSALITPGDSKAYFFVPAELTGLTLTEVALSCSTVASAGTTTVQIRRVRSGVSADMLSTPLTIDAGEADSSTAAVPAVIDLASDDIQTNDQIHFDLDALGTDALGIYVSFTFD